MNIQFKVTKHQTKDGEMGGEFSKHESESEYIQSLKT
jgi:hypothetical protein